MNITSKKISFYTRMNLR